MKHNLIKSISLLVASFLFAACTDNFRDSYLEAPAIDSDSNFEPVDLSPLHVEGKYLKNNKGEVVNLHGFAQTFLPYFNENKWNNYDVDGCLQYNQNCIDAVLKAGWKVTFVRQHMDPYWCCGNYSGENVCYKTFNVDDFMKYLNLVYIPMAEYANKRGLFVVMRPPGVCPETIAAGDKYNDYLVQVWDSVSNHPKIKNNPGIMFELANEPVNIEGTDGSVGGTEDPQFEAMSQFLQPIVDVIRENGANNVIWLPGLGYQSWFTGFPNYPIRGENLGFAIHCYPGWYGSDAEQDSGEGIGTSTGGGYTPFQTGWDKQIGPVVDMAPLMVTEMDWAASKYNSTWGRGETGEAGGKGFGANFKYITDNCGNVSWLIFTGQEHLKAFVDEPGEEGNYTLLNDPQSCLWPVYHWYQDYVDVNSDETVSVTGIYAKIGGVDYAPGSSFTLQTGDFKYIVIHANYSDGTNGAIPLASCEISSSNTKVAMVEKGTLCGLTDGNSDITVACNINGDSKTVTFPANVTSFPLDAINAAIFAEGGSYNKVTHTLITGINGYGGWLYKNGLNLSDFNYLVVELCKGSNIDGNVSFRMYDENNYWSSQVAMFSVRNHRLIINLKNQQVDEGKAVDPSHLYMVGFWTPGGEQNKVAINRIYPTNDYPEDTYVAPDPPTDGSEGDDGDDDGDKPADDLVIPINEWKTLFDVSGTSFNTATGEIITGQYGAVGWEGSWDLSKHHYLIVELGENSKYDADEYSFRLFDQGYWNNCATFILADHVTDYKLKIDLTQTINVTNDKKEVLRVLNRATISNMAFWSTGYNPVYVKKVYATNKNNP